MSSSADCQKTMHREALLPSSLPTKFPDLPITEAIQTVIVPHSHRLHECVADGGAYELETAPQKIAAQRIRLDRPAWNRAEPPAVILFWFSADKSPEIGVECSE